MEKEKKEQMEKELKEAGLDITDLKTGDDFLRDLSDKMSGFVMDKHNKQIEKTKLKIEEIDKSNHKNKGDIITKYKELIEKLNKTTELTKLVTGKQKELIDLEQSKDKLKSEIEDLLISEDGRN